jgi:biotin carboxyl carrier protein
MKLQAEIGDEEFQLEIKNEGGEVFADINGHKYQLEVSEPEAGVYLLKNEGKIFEVFISPPKDARNATHVRVGGSEFEIKLIDPKRLRGAGGNDEHADGLAEIKTAMPGKVVRILVEKGSDVKKGDGILVVEAMKMQNELKSPKSGVVKELRVEEGSTVSAGDVLATIM